MKRQLIALSVIVLLLLGGAGLWHQATFERGALSTPPPGLETTLLPRPKALEGFRLTDSNDHPFTPQALRTGWTFLFFGYTHCPDVCPTTLTTLGGFSRALAHRQPGLAADTHYVFVSVDPKRDTPAHLKEYVHYFDPAFLGATGAKAQIDALVRQVGAVYTFDGDTSGDDYAVNHSATLYLVDPKGRYVARFFPPHQVDELLKTYQRVRTFESR